MRDLNFAKIRTPLLLFIFTIFINGWVEAQVTGQFTNVTPGVEYTYVFPVYNCQLYTYHVTNGIKVTENLNSITIKWANTQSKGYLSMRSSGGANCDIFDNTSDEFDIQINYQASVPPISGNEICCNQQSDYAFIAGALFPDPDVTLAGGTGTYTYQWQKSSDASNWSNISGATSATYSPGAINNTTYFRRVVTSGSVVDNGNIITVTVSFQGPAVEGVGPCNFIAYDRICNDYKVFCNDVATVTLVSFGPPDVGSSACYSLEWQKSLDNVNWSNVSNQTTKQYRVTVTDHTVYYRLKSHYYFQFPFCLRSSAEYFTESVKVRRFDEHEHLKSGEYTGRYIFKGWQSVTNKDRPDRNANVVVKNGANMKLRSMDEIELLPPFSIEEGADFTAEIGELCQLGNWREGSEIPNSSLETELSSKNEIRIFPNPTDGFFHVLLNLPSEKLIKMSVFNLQGREVKVIPQFAGQNVEKDIDLQNQNSGMYIVEVDIDGKIERHKIIINK